MAPFTVTVDSLNLASLCKQACTKSKSNNCIADNAPQGREALRKAIDICPIYLILKGSEYDLATTASGKLGCPFVDLLQMSVDLIKDRMFLGPADFTKEVSYGIKTLQAP